MSEALADLDFAVRCNCAKEFNGGVACTADAARFVEIHPVDWCDRVEVNENRNATGFLCHDHLKLYEHRAIDEARSINLIGYARLCTFATVRLRTKVTKGPGSRAAGMAMAYKLIEAT